MKSYKVKSSAQRQARKEFGSDYLTLGSIVSVEGGFTFELNEVVKATPLPELDAFFAPTEPEVKVTKALNKEDQALMDSYGTVNCPHCDVNLGNGCSSNDQQIDAGLPMLDKYENVCLGCGEEFGPEITITFPKNKNIIKTNSDVDAPCKLVWIIAEGMVGHKRKDIIAECVKQGVAYNTARTQYQSYFKALKAD